MVGKLNEEEIDEILSQHYVGRIGCHAEGITYVVPISYAYHDGYIYARTFEGMKIDIMRQNPNICFEVDYVPAMANWKSVIAWGQYEELPDKEDRNNALRILLERKIPSVSSIMTKFAADWPFCSIDCEDVPGVFFRVLLTEKTGRFEINEASYAFVM